MYYCILKSDGYIIGTASSEIPFAESVSEAEANEVKGLFLAKPNAEEGYEYRLRADDMTWELVELPPQPEPDPDPEEALSILLGGAEE